MSDNNTIQAAPTCFQRIADLEQARACQRRQIIWQRLLLQLDWRLNQASTEHDALAIGLEILAHALAASGRITHDPDQAMADAADCTRLVFKLAASDTSFSTLVLERAGKPFTYEQAIFARAAVGQLRLALRATHAEAEALAHATALNSAYSAAVESARLRTLGLLAAGIAHDFNNLLTVILGRAQLLELTVATLEQHEDLRIIQRAAETGAASVRRIQSFARPQLPQRVPLDLATVAADALEFSRAQWSSRLRARGLTIALINRLTPLPLVLGDSQPLRELFLNLILNAIDAMPDGGALTLSCGSDAANVWVAIGDTGVGISQEQQETIFEPFVSYKTTGGYGLGLAMAHQTVLNHNGAIQVQSTLGVGTTMTVVLLRSNAAQPHDQHAPAATPLRILLVDADESARSALAQLLAVDAHIVSVVGDAPTAHIMLEHEAYDVVIADEGLPDAEGLQLLHYAHELRPGCTTILLSFEAAEHSNAERASSNSDMITTKPVDPAALRRLLAGHPNHENA